MMKTINYYNNNAQAFYNRTIDSNVAESYKKFLKYIPKHAHILDAGCGVGRDSKYFLKMGYLVTAFDASQGMVDLATKETNLNVQLLSFQDIDFYNEFDAVWASASLLHVPYNETRKVYQKIYNALKPKGVFFASYKYGQDYISIDERDFWSMDESKILPYFEGLFDVIDLKKDIVSKISPRGSEDQIWLSFIAKKG